MTTRFETDEGRVLVVNDEAGTKVEIKGGISSDGFGVIATIERAGLVRLGYVRDAKGVWWFDGRKAKATFVTPEIAGFRVLDDDYGVAAGQVFLEDRPIPEADGRTFELLPNSPYFARDRHRLYIKNGRHFFRFDDADAATLVAHGAYCSDKDHLFHLYDTLSYANDNRDEIAADLRAAHPDVVGWWHPDYDTKPDGAEPLDFAWHRTARAVFFRTEAGSVLHRNQRSVWNLVRGADPATFEALSADFGRDAEAVYLRWRRIAGADPDSFEPIDERFGQDASGVYVNGYPVEGADRASFHRFPDAAAGLARDKARVYRKGLARTSWPFGHPDEILEAIEDADAASFALCSPRGSWAVDDGRVYLWGKPAAKIDRASFVFLADQGVHSWARDDTALWNANGKRQVKGIDGRSFEALNRFWGKDDKAVFCFVTEGVQRAADAATFQVTDDKGGAEDAGHRYRIEAGTIKKAKR